MRRAKAGAIALLVFALGAACGGGGARVVGKTDEALAGVRRFASVAENANDFRNIWQKAPSNGELSDAAKAVSTGRSAGFTLLRNGASEFKAAYNTTNPDELVILVGHNIDGSFRFPDNSFLSLSDLGSRERGMLVVLSCDSARHVTGEAIGVIPTTITYQVSYRAQAILVAALNALEERPSRAALQDLLNSAVDDAVAELRAEGIQRTVVGVGAGTGALAAGVGLTQVFESR